MPRQLGNQQERAALVNVMGERAGEGQPPVAAGRAAAASAYR